MQRYAKVYDNVNSISHRADFVSACLDTWKLRAPFGIYNGKQILLLLHEGDTYHEIQGNRPVQVL